jgi:hypothetical protein
VKKFNEKGALAIVFGNTRRKKRYEDLVTIAKAFKYLANLYGSKKKLSNRIGLSVEMIREFLAVLKLPKEVQELVNTRRIDSIDTVKELIALQDQSKQIGVAKAIADLQSKDTRDIKRLIKKLNMTVEEAKEVVTAEKPKGMHVFVIDFDNEVYRELNRRAKALKTAPVELVRKMITKWLQQK